MRHLDPKWELENPGLSLVAHFWETIDSIGGWKGLCVIGAVIGIFHAVVNYVIANGRRKREEARLRKQR